MAAYPTEIRNKAIEIAIKEGYKAASESTGVARATIRSWMSRYRKTTGKVDAVAKSFEGEKPPKTQPDLETPGELAARSFSTASVALDRISEELDEGNTKRSKEDSLWLRSVVGSFKVLVDVSQLLSGKPTSREALVREESKRELIKTLTEDRKLAGKALPVLLEIAGSNGHRTGSSDN